MLGVRHTRGKTGWWTQEDHEFRVPVHINDLGLRDVEHAYAKESQQTRILLLGDSFIEALQVRREQSLGRQLAARLGPASEVVSAGVSGYGTASEFMFLEHEGWRYDPDLVMLAFYPGNDVKNNSPTLEDALRPRYQSDGTLLRVEGSDGDTASASHARKGWWERSQAFRYTRQLVLLHPGVAGPLHTLGLLKIEGPRRAPERNGVPIDYEVFRPEVDPEWQDAWEHTFRLLGDMSESVRKRGKRFAVIIVPSRYQIYPVRWAEALAAHPAMQKEVWDVDMPVRRMVAWCETRGIACVDLTSTFRLAAAEATPLYFHYDGHWTAAGHELAARAVAAFLRAQNLVPAQSQ